MKNKLFINYAYYCYAYYQSFPAVISNQMYRPPYQRTLIQKWFS
jgi:hypothetical protein